MNTSEGEHKKKGDALWFNWAYMITSAVLAMFDVYTDYWVLTTLWKGSYFIIMAAIIGFAALAITLQLWRIRRYTQVFLFDYLLLLLSLVQGHWVVLVIMSVLLRYSTEHLYKTYYVWFQSTLLTAVVLESIPQLLLQLYIVLVSQSASGTGIIISLLFSALMAGKTIVLRMLDFKGSFKGPKQSGKTDELVFHRSTVVWSVLFCYASLISRSVILVVAALGFNALFFAVIGGMAAWRFVKEIVPDLGFSVAKALSPANLLLRLQLAIAGVFRDVWNDRVTSWLSFIEVAIIYYLLIIRNDVSLNPIANKPIFNVTIVVSTLLRVLSNFVIRRKVNTNTAVYVEAHADLRAAGVQNA